MHAAFRVRKFRLHMPCANTRCQAASSHPKQMITKIFTTIGILSQNYYTFVFPKKHKNQSIWNIN